MCRFRCPPPALPRSLSASCSTACAQLLDAGDGAADIIASTGAKSALPKIIKAGYSALNVRHGSVVRC